MTIRALLPLLVSIGFAGAAAAQGFPGDPPVGAGGPTIVSVRQCNGNDPVPAIMGCTAIITARSSTPTQRSAALTNRGRAYLRRDQPDRALADFDQAIAIDPMNSRGWANRGDFHQQQGEFDRAVADYDRAIMANPMDFEAYSQRGNVRLIMGEPERAIPDYDQGDRGQSEIRRSLHQSR